MEDEKIGITVEVEGTGAGIKSVKELKDAIKQLEKTASEADYGSEEYKKATEEANKLKTKMAEISGESTAKMNTSLKGLQQEYKRLKVALNEAASPEEFSRLSKELNNVEGKIGDINDAASLATGSGVEQLNKGIGLLGEGFRNFDFEKIKIGFKGIGNAMSAVVPLLLIQGLVMLVENFDKVVEVVKELTNTFSDEEMQVKNTTKAYEEQKKVTSALVSQYENEIKILEAKGGNEAKILELKKLKIAAQIQELKSSVAVVDATIREIEANNDLSESVASVNAWIQRKLGNDKLADIYDQAVHAQKLERTKEQQEKKEESLKSIASLEADLVVLQINNDKKVTENYKKSLEERKKINDDFWKDANKKLEEQADADLAAMNAEIKREADKEKAIADDKERHRQFELQQEKEKAAAKKAADEKELADAKKLEQDKAKQKEIIENLSFNAAKSLSDAIFSIQLSNVKKGSDEELKLRKQAFQLDKAFAITKATMDGYKSVLSTFADTPGGFVIKTAAASLAGVFAAAQIAKIAASKFEGSATTGGANISAPTQIGSTSVPTPPTINPTTTSTTFDNQGNNLGASTERQAQQPIKVYVTENDISEVQKRANKLKTQTTI